MSPEEELPLLSGQIVESARSSMKEGWVWKDLDLRVRE